MKSKRLGRGLEALIPQVSPEEEQTLSNNLDQIPIDQIVVNPLQPRHDFDPGRLEELKQSIAENGIIQPVTIYQKDGRYELVSGERRFRAVSELGYDKIPAYIIEVESDDKLLELALIENIQREDLNPMELALAYQKLQSDYGLKQEEVARKVGKDRATVANFIRLLKLPDEVQDAVRTDKISMGHARALMGLESIREQREMCLRIMAEGWSVRRVEEAVREASESPVRKIKNKAPAPVKDKALAAVEDRFRTLLGTQVQVKPSGNGGKIEIAYYTNEDLERLIELFEQID